MNNPSLRPRFTDDWDQSQSHTMVELVHGAAGDFGDDLFIVEEDGRTQTFREFEANVDAAARALIAQGVEFGDRVAIQAPNSGAWMVAACAIEIIGAAMTPINTRFRGPEAGYILGKSGARVLFTVGEFLGSDYLSMLQSALGSPTGERPVAGLPLLKSAVFLDLAAARPGALAWEQFLASQAPVEALRAREAQVRPDTIADVMFTSGTTGNSKGAMHAHGQAVWMVSTWNQANDLRRGDRALIINPFFHSFGYRSGWVSALLSGGRAYPVAVFNAEAALRRIEAEKISVLMGSPTLFTSILDHPRRGEFDLSSLRVAHTGSSKVPVELIRRLREELDLELVLTSFGLTEASALVSCNYPGDDFATIARTVGRPIPGTEIRIISPEGETLPPGASGELLVRGPNVMRGYLDDPAATAEAIDSAGWLHTGDVAQIDAEGRLRILDRMKDVVIVGGFNAYPVEIENVLSTHPAIAEVAVLGVPDDRLGEVCAACVVLKPGAGLTLAELTTWARERLANFKAPRHLLIEDSLPRTPLGKVQKFLLKQAVLKRLDMSATPVGATAPTRGEA